MMSRRPRDTWRVAMAEHSHSTGLVLWSVPDQSGSYAAAEVGVLMCY